MYPCAVFSRMREEGERRRRILRRRRRLYEDYVENSLLACTLLFAIEIMNCLTDAAAIFFPAYRVELETASRLIASNVVGRGVKVAGDMTTMTTTRRTTTYYMKSRKIKHHSHR